MGLCPNPPQGLLALDLGREKSPYTHVFAK